MKERERQHEEPIQPTAGGTGGEELDSYSERSARLLSAGDDAIARALSTDSRAFLRANRQQGGQ
jgi:hypothetical protein